MRKKIVPQTFVHPKKYDFDNWYAVPILASNALEDWLILVPNADAISQQRGVGSREEWPYTCTLEENFKDLAWLEMCAHYNQLFSYIIRDKKDDRYVGCLYIYPIELFSSDHAEKHNVDFSFWITQEEYDKGSYAPIFKHLIDWLVKDWKFDREEIYLRNAEIPAELNTS